MSPKLLEKKNGMAYRNHTVRIDFHTHIYPDRVASQTVSTVCRRAGIDAYADGTLDGLKRSMAAAAGAGCIHSTMVNGHSTAGHYSAGRHAPRRSLELRADENAEAGRISRL